MNTIIISIIIPAYNAAKTIEKCLSSIFSQTFQNLEIIVVNDGSTDNTLEILQAYEGKIKIIDQPNGGACAARNRGANHSNGVFIIFCDADITMQPQMIEKMYSTLKNNPQSSYAYSSFKFGFKTFKLFDFDTEKLKAIPYIHTTSLIRKEHFPGFDENLKRFQDWDLWLTMLKKGYVGKFIPEILFEVESGGTMSSWLPKAAFKLPFLNNNEKVKKYIEAESIIKQKHNL